ncbi:MAG: AAA family ATPase, partial [Candidatus Hydrothermarchaeota archaeon]
MEEIELKVGEARAGDVGRGIARVESKVMEKLNLSSGDVIEILGKKRTVARVWRGYPEDEGLGIIRMDGIIRKNAGVGIDDKVKIRKIEAKLAKKVKLAPAEAVPGVDLSAFASQLKKILENFVVTKGDLIPISSMFLPQITFVVTNITPSADAGIITYDTEIDISSKPAKEVVLRKVPRVTYEDIGGLKNEVQKIREMIELPLKHPELFEKLGIEPPKGVLL